MIGTVPAPPRSFQADRFRSTRAAHRDETAEDYYDIAVDVVQAGVGDKVMVIDEGNGARQILQREVAPVRAVIVGVVDDVQIGE